MPNSTTSTFIEEHDLAGNISLGDLPPVQVHFRIRRDPTNRTPVTASVFGTKSTALKLFSIRARARPYLTLRTNNSGRALNVFSDEVVFNGPHMISRPDVVPEIINDEIGSMEFDRVIFQHNLDMAPDRQRWVVMFLQGPSDVWGTFGSMMTSYTGRVIPHYENTLLRLGKRYPFTIRIAPHFFYSSAKIDGRELNYSTKTYAMTFNTKVLPNEFSDQEFVKQAISITEDLTNIASFLSQQYVTWYAYSLSGTKGIHTEVRRLAYKEPKRVDFNDLVVNPTELQKFLRTAFRKLPNLRHKKIDPNFAIRLYVSSFESFFVEEQLIAAFRALENLISLLIAKSKKDILLPNSKFSKLRTKMDKLIKSNVTSNVHARMGEKLSELNRQTLLRSMQDVCKRLHIPIKEGLYADGDDLTFIRTRNKLVHGDAIKDIGLIDKETTRIRALTERIILRLFGWKNLTRSPPRYKSDWLKGKPS